MTTVYGTLYGLEYLKEWDDFSVEVFIDCINERIKALDYEGPNIEAMVSYLHFLATENGFGKVVMVAREDDWELFVAQGYVLEGLIRGYFSGVTGYCLSRFFDSERGFSPHLEEENEIIRNILSQQPGIPLKPLPSGCFLHPGTREDIAGMVELFTKVFASYPTPLNRPDYLEQVIGEKAHFMVIENRGRIISAA